ncbi:uncharacterized protein KRP23_12568 [Phytophthora ramorum]|uniref:Temptin Cys/Cys disulfide domain-containing protein n=1 Tax=Phytophthora ramorum TaxID=164328 RepID=H3GX92_PHYRM|nr:hypothetical protein KRP23_12568 [Phytophthora ramorum]
MLSTVQIAVVAAAVAAHTASAYSSYMELIPNGENIGKTLGHTDSGYTDFGTLFSDDGTDWAKVCTQTWPGGSVTCGEALGDPCCTWSSGDPDYTLTEPNTDGTTCASSSTATSAATSTASSAATETTSTAASGSNSTDTSTTATEDGSYCE